MLCIDHSKINFSVATSIVLTITVVEIKPMKALECRVDILSTNLA